MRRGLKGSQKTGRGGYDEGSVTVRKGRKREPDEGENECQRIGCIVVREGKGLNQTSQSREVVSQQKSGRPAIVHPPCHLPCHPRAVPLL